MTLGFNYEIFREKIINNPLRSNNFRFFLENVDLVNGYLGGLNFGFLNPPDVFNANIDELMIEFFISGVQMPSRYSGIINVNFQGSQIKFSGEAGIYDPLILNIQENGKCEAYNFFNKWFDKTQSLRSGLMNATTRLVNGLDEYNGLLVIFSDEVVTVVKFYGLFPLLITGFSLAWQSQEIVSYPIHLAFDYLEVLGTYTPENNEYKYYKELSSKK